MPLANGFLSADSIREEFFFPLSVAFCPQCNMVQLVHQPRRDQMFGDMYPFFSESSRGMDQHFSLFAAYIRTDLLRDKINPLVVEIGSNDGIMLKYFSDRGVRNIGVEPSLSVAKISKDKGLHTIVDFFDEKLAMKIVSKHGNADVISAANVMCHIPYIHSVISGIKELLKPDGFLVFEDPYLRDIINKTTYDQIYDEHVFFFSVHSLPVFVSNA